MARRETLPRRSDGAGRCPVGTLASLRPRRCHDSGGRYRLGGGAGRPARPAARRPRGARCVVVCGAPAADSTADLYEDDGDMAAWRTDALMLSFHLCRKATGLE